VELNLLPYRFPAWNADIEEVHNVLTHLDTQDIQCAGIYAAQPLASVVAGD
jgi:hypothetical protein